MRRGFTLIELVATIVILAILLLIAVPQILDVISNARKGAFESDAKLLADAIQKERLTDEDFDYTTVNESTVSSVLGLSNENYASVDVTEDDGSAHLVVVGKNKWDGLTAYGTFDDMRIDDSTDYKDENKCDCNIDMSAPVITFGTNGNSNPAKSYSTIVTVDSNTQVNSLKYQWTTSTVTPTADSFSTTFSNGDAISTPAGVDGAYYLWILLNGKISSATITMIAGSHSFNLDNTVPTTPTSGGMTTLGTIDETGGSTDLNSITYKYLVKTTSSVPSNTDSGFSTTRTYSNSCGNTYYGFSIAVDVAGNISGVRSQGSISSASCCVPNWTTGGCTYDGQIVTHTDGCGHSHQHTCSCGLSCIYNNDFCTSCTYGVYSGPTVYGGYSDSNCKTPIPALDDCWSSDHVMHTTWKAYGFCATSTSNYVSYTSCSQPN